MNDGSAVVLIYVTPWQKMGLVIRMRVAKVLRHQDKLQIKVGHQWVMTLVGIWLDLSPLDGHRQPFQ